MKNHIEEPANINSVSELAARLEAGEVFYDEDGYKYWFDNKNKLCPFRCGDDQLTTWGEFASLKTRREINWWEVEGALPALCVVERNGNKTIALIGRVDRHVEFEDAVHTNIVYAHARPATMEEIKQYIKA